MNSIEVLIKATVDSGELLAMLEGSESLGAWEGDGVIHLFWPEDKWNPEAWADLKRVLAGFGIDDPEGILTTRTVPDQDWNAEWAASLMPIRLGRRIRIRQSWHTADPDLSVIELVIDPKRAFGTGYHATTQLVIEWLEDHIRGRERVLDIGTGSGILSMAAIRMGAASALAIDNDPVALECAREYCDVNGFGAELELRVSSFENIESHGFDVVLANLDIRTMPLLCPHLPRLMKAGGIACLCGLQEQDLREIMEVLSLADLQIEAVTKREEWVALSIRNPQRP
jgi:ribosomal protein L11 methyltransferase